MSQKNCIFHVPNFIDPLATSGSHVRPLKMMNAFKAIGYNVDIIMGYGKERKQQIKEIKNNIKSGIKYDFMYSESSTMPTLLTEKNHLPTYPFLDFGFFTFCKKHGIKIGLFYRDIHWKFPVYKKNVSLLKRIISIPMYKYDLTQYKKFVNVLYLPSNKMKEYVHSSNSIGQLPPGCDIASSITKKITSNVTSNMIKLLYVGGIQGIYDLSCLLKTIKDLDFISLTICCRDFEWEASKARYNSYMTDRINVVHTSGEDLAKYYVDADICMIFFESTGYWTFAVPIKMFEYLAHTTPIIACSGSVAGDFVEKNKIGWSIAHSEKELANLLRKLHANRSLIDGIQGTMLSVAKENTWDARANQVVSDISALEEIEKK